MGSRKQTVKGVWCLNVTTLVTHDTLSIEFRGNIYSDAFYISRDLRNCFIYGTTLMEDSQMAAKKKAVKKAAPKKAAPKKAVKKAAPKKKAVAKKKK